MNLKKLVVLLMLEKYLKIQSDEYKWKNLNLFTLKSISSFGLFEAMSAIEMMDPKMDAGLLINQSKSKIKSVDDAIKVWFFE
jgi:hypothetical protein